MRRFKKLGLLCLVLSFLFTMTTNTFADAANNGVKPEETLIELVSATSNTTVEVRFADEVKEKKVDFAISEMYGPKTALGITDVTFSEDGKVATITTASQKGSTLYKLVVTDLKVKHVGKTEEISKAFVGMAPPVSEVKLVAAQAKDNKTVEVTFDMEVDVTNANFSIVEIYGMKLPLDVTSYELSADKKTVTLHTASQKGVTLYRVTASNVIDMQGRISETLTGTFVGIMPPPPPVDPNPSPVQIATVVAVSNTQVDVTFDMEVDITNAKFNLDEAYGTRAALAITSYELSADKKTVSLYTASQKAATLYKVTAIDLKDMDNRVSGTLTRVFVGMAPLPPPVDPNPSPVQIASVTAVSNTQVDVTFDMEVDIANALFRIGAAYGTDTQLEITSYMLSEDKKTVSIKTAPQTASMLFRLNVTGLKDMNNRVSGTLSGVFVGMPPANQSPVQIINVAAVDYTKINVDFDMEVDITNAKFTINEAYGMRAPLEITGYELSADRKTVTLYTASQKPFMLYRITVSDIKDMENRISGTLNRTFVGIAPPPPVQIEATIAVDNTRVDIFFNKQVDISSANFNIQAADGTGQQLAVTYCVLSEDKTRASLYTEPQTAGILYDLTATGIKDMEGTISGTLNSIFASSAATSPVVEISGSVAVDNTKVNVYFNQEIDISNANFNIVAENESGDQLLITGYEQGADKSVVSIYTAPQTAGVVYRLTASDLRDRGNRTIETLSCIFAGSGYVYTPEE